MVRATNANPYHSDRSTVKDIHVEDGKLIGVPDNGVNDSEDSTTVNNGWQRPTTTGNVNWDKQDKDFNMKSASRRANPNGKKQR